MNVDDENDVLGGYLRHVVERYGLTTHCKCNINFENMRYLCVLM